MKKTMTTSDIANELHSDEYGGWSYAGAYALAEYLEELEESTGEEMEFDRVAIRCDFSEYRSLYQWADDYFAGDSWMEEMEVTEGMVENDEHEEIIREYIQDHGQLVEFDGGIIVSSF